MSNVTRSAVANPRPLRTIWWCALTIAVSVVFLTSARVRFSPDPKAVFTKTLRPGSQGQDSWIPMNVAFDYLRSPHSVPVYTKVFIHDHVKFQYPLTALLPFYLVRNPLALNKILLAVVVLICPLMVLLFNRFLRMALPEGLADDGPGERLIDRVGRIAIPLLMTLTFYPLNDAYRLGQLQVWLVAGFMLLLWLWTENRYLAAGLIAGLLTCGKPQFGLLLIWAATRKNWSFCTGFLIAAGVVAAASVACFGIADNLDYLTVLSELSRRGESWWANQSINGLLNRVLRNDIAFDWKGYYLPGYKPLVYFGTMLSSLAFIAGAIFVPARFRGGIADLMLASLTCTIASPVAWTHHYSILLPMFAAMLVWAAVSRPLGRGTFPVICVSYILIGTYLGSFSKLALSRLNFIQSYPLFGVLMALVVLYAWVIRGEPGGATAVTKERRVVAGINETARGKLVPQSAA